MRVLHLYANWKWTGPAEPAVNLARALAGQGHEVLFVPGSSVEGLPNQLAQKALERGLTVRQGLTLDKHIRLLDNWRDVRKLTALFREFAPHVVHCHTLNDHLVGGTAARRCDPSLPVVRSLYDGEPPGRGVRQQIVFRGLTGFLISASEQVRRETARRFSLPREQTQTIDVPVDLRRFDPGRELPDLAPEYGIQPGDYVVGLVARMQSHRKFDLFFAALDRAFREGLGNLRVLVVGRGTRFEDVRGLAGNTSLPEDRVVFTGYRKDDEYAATLAAMDVKIYMHPGSDGSCRAVREAMAMGKPVIAAAVGMLPEIVQDGVSGLLFPYREEALAAAVTRLASPEERARMAAAARSTALERFSLQGQAHNVEAIYRQLTRDRK
ncbi:MAG: glycosyltransferase family 4 protein [Desulfohalobiaceae bacterium]